LSWLNHHNDQKKLQHLLHNPKFLLLVCHREILLNKILGLINFDLRENENDDLRCWGSMLLVRDRIYFIKNTSLLGVFFYLYLFWWSRKSVGGLSCRGWLLRYFKIITANFFNIFIIYINYKFFLPSLYLLRWYIFGIYQNVCF